MAKLRQQQKVRLGTYLKATAASSLHLLNTPGNRQCDRVHAISIIQINFYTVEKLFKMNIYLNS